MRRLLCLLAPAAALVSAPSSAQCDPTPLPGVAGVSKAIAMSGETIFTSYAPGVVAVHDQGIEVWNPVTTLAPSTGPSNSFGTDVALFGSRGIVSDAGTRSLFAFRRTDGVWTEQQVFTAADSTPLDELGFAIDLDGNRIVAGAPSAPVDGVACGAVYVFELIGQSWTEVAKVVPPAPLDGARFGHALAVDGDHLLVGAPGGGSDAGVMFAYELDAGGWQLTAQFAPSISEVGDEFGSALAMRFPSAVVGAPGNDGDFGSDAGRVFTYQFVDGAWSESQELLPGGVPSGNGAEFGRSVSLNDQVLLIGAPAGSNPGLAGRCHAYVRQGAAWGEVAFFESNNAGTADSKFARVVEQSGDWVILGSDTTTYTFPIVGLGSTLSACPRRLSTSAGGSQTLRMYVGAELGNHWYFVLGSMSGKVPGLTFGEFHLPLNPDSYFLLTQAQPADQPLNNAFGLLDFYGRAQAEFAVAPGQIAALAGGNAHHAFLVLDFWTFEILHASNAIIVQFGA